MNHSRIAFHEAWNACGRGALFSSRHTSRIPARPAAYFYSTARPSSLPSTQWPSRSSVTRFDRQSQPHSHIIRHLQTSSLKSQEAARPSEPAKSAPAAAKDVQEAEPRQRIKDEEELAELAETDPEEFGKTERAAQNAKLDLSARLSKDGSSSKGGSFSEIWRLIKIARPEAKWLIVAVGLLITSSAITMSIPASVGRILDIATNPDANKQMLFGLDLTTFYIGLGGILTLGACANYGRVRILRIVGERIVTRQRSKLYSNTFIQNAEFFDANRVGDLISRLGSDTIIVGKSVTQNLSDGLRAFISGAAGLSLMAYTSIKLTSVLALLFPPVAIGAFFYGRAIRNLSRKIQQNLGTLTKIAEERLGNVRTAQAFAGEVQEVGRYNRQVRRIFNLGKREAVLSATFFGASGWAGNMTVLALLYIGGGLVKAGDISVGELTSFLMYTAYAGSSMFGLSSFYSELMRGVGAASRLFELQDRRPTIAPTVGLPVKSLQGPIQFEDVGFSYPTRPAVNIFRDLSFTIEEGMNVAIVAPSGAGKSTVASLLMRFYTPTAGRILVNGINIADMNAKQLRRKIGYVGQEPVLFSGTIAENIAYGRPTATRAEILYAARRANCTFIGDFPDGLETHVGPRGTQLSGGQKQRIAIARALLKDPDILILDEATSALDAESETQVNAALASLLRGHNTTISIAHRMSTIKRSDRIICLGSDGRVAEVGTFAQLSSQDGAFKRLMEHQMSGGEDVGLSAARRQDGDRHDQHRQHEHEHDDEESEGDKVTQQMLDERKQRGG